jgi:hypothetical protein
MAEVLATDHGGCLPVVLDDAFANCDPERVNQIQRMLDLAAIRGLQIIILTCNPSDYAALGAHQILLRQEHATSTHPQTLATTNPLESPVEPVEKEATPPPVAMESATVVTAAATDDPRAQLLARLRELGGRAGNQSLRAALGWDEATYTAVKDDLVSSGQITPGKGRGGSVALPVPPIGPHESS